MKRILFILLCGVWVLSCVASTATNQPIKSHVEKITESKSGTGDIALKAKDAIKKWKNNQDGFTHTASDPCVLEKRVSSGLEALTITQKFLLSQSKDFKAEDKSSKICKYESVLLRVYYTEIGKDDVLARAIVIFNLNTKPEVYILVFKK